MMKKGTAGTAEITVLLEPDFASNDRTVLLQCVHDHLMQKDPNAVRVQHFACPSCGDPVENSRAIKARIARGLKDIVCANCEVRVPISDYIEDGKSRDMRDQIRRVERASRESLERDSEELVLGAHVYSVVAETSHAYHDKRPGELGGEIEFRTDSGELSGQRVNIRFRNLRDDLIEDIAGGHANVTLTPPARERAGTVRPLLMLFRGLSGEILSVDLSEYLVEYRKAEVKGLGESGSSKNAARVWCPIQAFTPRSIQGLRSKYFPSEAMLEAASRKIGGRK
jgi:hypothetical protein